jgi:oxalate decarboxylase/phosphoglucose isomerase-like protein (cupin superfamily)
MVGIKNWKPENDASAIDCLERHNETDELFVLLAGKCVLLYANEKSGTVDIQAMPMDQGKLYKIPRSLWHTTVTMKETKLLLVEDSATSSKNSDMLKLDASQMALIRKIVRL